MLRRAGLIRSFVRTKDTLYNIFQAIENASSGQLLGLTCVWSWLSCLSHFPAVISCESRLSVYSVLRPKPPRLSRSSSRRLSALHGPDPILHKFLLGHAQIHMHDTGISWTPPRFRIVRVLVAVQADLMSLTPNIDTVSNHIPLTRGCNANIICPEWCADETGAFTVEITQVPPKARVFVGVLILQNALLAIL